MGVTSVCKLTHLEDTSCKEYNASTDVIYRIATNGSLFFFVNGRLKDIYGEYEEGLERISPEDDLRWYAVNYGTGMAYDWPEYEVY